MIKKTNLLRPEPASRKCHVDGLLEELFIVSPEGSKRVRLPQLNGKTIYYDVFNYITCSETFFYSAAYSNPFFL